MSKKDRNLTLPKTTNLNNLYKLIILGEAKSLSRLFYLFFLTVGVGDWEYTIFQQPTRPTRLALNTTP